MSDRLDGQGVMSMLYGLSRQERVRPSLQGLEDSQRTALQSLYSQVSPELAVELGEALPAYFRLGMLAFGREEEDVNSQFESQRRGVEDNLEEYGVDPKSRDLILGHLGKLIMSVSQQEVWG